MVVDPDLDVVIVVIVDSSGSLELFGSSGSFGLPVSGSVGGATPPGGAGRGGGPPAGGGPKSPADSLSMRHAFTSFRGY